MSSDALITGEEFATFTDLGRAELIDGQLMPMPFHLQRHGRCVARTSWAIGNFVTAHGWGEMLTGGSGVYIRHNPDTVRGMDVAYISNERWACQTDKDGYLEVAPDLIVEVLSPDDRWNAVTRKLHDYFAIGVRQVWVADPEARAVYVYRAVGDMRAFEEAAALTGDEVLPGFSVGVSELFE